MNEFELGSTLKEIRLHQKISKYKMNKYFLINQKTLDAIENGENYTITKLLNYLRAIETPFFILNKNENEQNIHLQKNAVPKKLEDLGVFLKTKREKKNINYQHIVDNFNLQHYQIKSLENGSKNYQIKTLLIYLEAINCYFFVENIKKIGYLFYSFSFFCYL